MHMIPDAPSGRRGGMQTWAASVRALAAVAAVGCAERDPGVIAPQPPKSRVAAALTPSAGVVFNTDGKIVLPAPRGGPYAELSAARATALAQAWTRHFAPWSASFLEETHGAPIDLQRLRPCGRALYARAAFETPPADLPAPLRRPYGPWWLVTMCSATGVPQVSVAVSAWATEVRLVDGRIRFPEGVVAGNEFLGLGIPQGHTGEYPVSPEAAVTRAFAQTRRHVAAVPELVMASPDQAPPQGAHWTLQLDGPAELRRGGARAGAAPVSASRVYVAPHAFAAPGDTTFVPSATQPEGVTFYWTTPRNPGERTEAYDVRRRDITTTIARRADTPTRFDRAITPEDR